MLKALFKTERAQGFAVTVTMLLCMIATHHVTHYKIVL